jgi:hypothetical protein
MLSHRGQPYDGGRLRLALARRGMSFRRWEGTVAGYLHGVVGGVGTAQNRPGTAYPLVTAGQAPGISPEPLHGYPSQDTASNGRNWEV